MGGRERVLMVEILRRQAQLENGTFIKGKRRGDEQPADPFEELEKELDRF